MARIIPVLEELMLPARPEHRILENIRNHLSDDWVVLHSLNVKDSTDLPLGDIDIILAGPSAIHGISLARSEASWIPWYSKGWLKENSDHLSLATPITALRSSFMTMLTEQVPELFNKYEPTVGIGFALWADHSEANSNIGGLVLNIDSDPEEFTEYFENLTRFWAKSTTMTAEIDKESRNAIVKKLRHTLDRRIPLVEDVMRLEQTRIELTQEQYEIFDAFDLEQKPRLFVEGGAGTGKSLCAIEIAKAEAVNGKRVMLTCFNKKLEDSFRKIIDPALGIKIVRIHELCRELVEEAGMSSILSDRVENDELYRAVYPDTARAAVKSLGANDIYDTIVMDEAQDIISDRYLNLYDDLLRGGIEGGTWAIFYDLNQDIFQTAESKAMDRLRNIKPFMHKFMVNCRNTLDIAEIAGGVSGIDPIKNKAPKGIIPRLLWYKDSNEQRDQISMAVAEWIDSGIDLDQIVVLSPKRLKKTALKNGLNREILDLPLADWDSDTVERPAGAVVFSTIASFKGLESEFVLLTGVDRIDQAWQRKLYYVGITRANTVLTLSISVKIRQKLMSAIQKSQFKGVEKEIPKLLPAQFFGARSRFTPKYVESIPESATYIPNKIMPSQKAKDASHNISQISASNQAAESYLSYNAPSEETWYGTWGPKVYEVHFNPDPEFEDRVTANARIIGYKGSSTQVNLGIDSTINRFIFIDGKGECEDEFAPSFESDLITNARHMFLVNENGDHVSMLRRDVH